MRPTAGNEGRRVIVGDALALIKDRDPAAYRKVVREELVARNLCVKVKAARLRFVPPPASRA